MRNKIAIFVAMILVVAFAEEVVAQPNTWTYQGNLVINGQPANGIYDFEFSLYDVPTGGSPVTPTAIWPNINVVNGVFSVELSFTGAFTGANRYLHILVKADAEPTFTVLTPRSQIKSVPYAVQSQSAVNAASLGGTSASQFVLTNDFRLSDARTPLPFSSEYVQNRTSPQAQTSFNVSGSGTVGGNFAATNIAASIIDVTGEYRIGGFQMFRATTVNTFVGAGAGRLATGTGNAFFGGDAGIRTTTGSGNSFFGQASGVENLDGRSNSFLGRAAGENNTSGDDNTFVGYFTGDANVTGNNNTLIGSDANVASGNLSFATAIGSDAIVGTNNTVVLGRVADQVIAPGTLIVGDRSSGRGGMNYYANSGNANFYMQGSGSTVGVNLAAGSGPGNPNFFISHYNGTTYTDRFVITPEGRVRINVLGTGGGTSLCQNASNEISTCSSSGRYKTNIADFRSGIDMIKRLRPVTFNWTAGNALDLGLVAEEVAGIDPLLVTYNDKGEVEGVKYDRIGVVLINTVKEQMTLIERQQKALDAQAEELARMRKALCRVTNDVEFCSPE